ncbi:MAG: hypothetical protein M3462_15270, partial [Chloroflexota bacterium]|nr:hypothetical protein [Chloroflexota bacterium]
MSSLSQVATLPPVATLPQVVAALQTVLTDVPGALARETGVCQRRSKLSGARFVQTLVFGWWQHPDATLAQLGQTAALGVTISPQGFDQRGGPAAAALLRDRLEAPVAQVVAAGPATPTDPAVSEVVRRVPAVLVLDSTTIAVPDALAPDWPDCGGRTTTGTRAALKATVRFDLFGGTLDGPEPSDGRTQDRATALQHAPVPPGALPIAASGSAPAAGPDAGLAGT